MLTFRRAGPADVVAVTDLTRGAYAKWVPLIGREPKPMTADYGAAMGRHRFDLLLDHDVLAGLIETVPDKDQLLIENVAVHPDLQGRGFGRLLMRRAEEIAAALGVLGVRLYTNKRFVENIRFYEALGYAVDREEEFRGGWVVHMSKRLTPEPSAGQAGHSPERW